MSQTPHPLDAWRKRRTTVRRKLIDTFLEDGTLSARERAALDLLANEDETVFDYRDREVAADSWKRNGVTRHTRSLFLIAGYDVIDIETDDTPANVVHIHTGRQGAG